MKVEGGGEGASFAQLRSRVGGGLGGSRGGGDDEIFAVVPVENFDPHSTRLPSPGTGRPTPVPDRMQLAPGFVEEL